MSSWSTWGRWSCWVWWQGLPPQLKEDDPGEAGQCLLGVHGVDGVAWLGGQDHSPQLKEDDPGEAGQCLLGVHGVDGVAGLDGQDHSPQLKEADPGEARQCFLTSNYCLDNLRSPVRRREAADRKTGTKKLQERLKYTHYKYFLLFRFVLGFAQV